MGRGGASTSNRLPLSRLAYPLIILRVISDESPTLSLFLLLQIKNKLSPRYAVSLEINTRKCRYYDTLLFTVIYYTVPLNPDAPHQIYTMPLPHTGPPTYDTIVRWFSLGVYLQEYLPEIPSGGC